jgi:site-specific recombinase XerD
LRRGGAANHLRPVTRDDLANRYGLFLDFVSRSGRLDALAAAGGHVTPDNVDDYVAELRQRVSSVTLYGSIYKLRRATQLMAPDCDVFWLRELEKDLDLVKQPKSKLNRLVLAEVLVAAGLTIMTEADAAERGTAVERATQYRNGLMVALLACCPIRLKNFAALSLGETLVQIADCWWIVLSAEQTKEKRADERRIPDFLSLYVDRYVSERRPVLAKSEQSSTACWLSRTGAPMSYNGVEATVTRTALATTGIPVSPHLFRTSAATTAAIHAGATPHLASAILDHRDTATTQQHYNRASSLTAGKAYLALGEMYRNGTSSHQD